MTSFDGRTWIQQTGAVLRLGRDGNMRPAGKNQARRAIRRLGGQERAEMCRLCLARALRFAFPGRKC